MGFVVHGVCEETSVETGKAIQNYRSGIVIDILLECHLIVQTVQ